MPPACAPPERTALPVTGRSGGGTTPAGPAIAARLGRRRLIADGVAELQLQLVEPAGFSYRAGQFVTLLLPQEQPPGFRRKTLSIAACDVRRGALRFIVRVAPSPAADPLLTIGPGVEVPVLGPQGSFVLDDHHAGDVVFAVTGTAIAPVLPMLTELVGRREAGRRAVFWGLRCEADIFLSEEIAFHCADAGFALRTFLSRPSSAWSGLRGRIIEPLVGLLPSLRAPIFYLVGNSAMVRELRQRLVDNGVDRRTQIRTEAHLQA
jgi:CDP-4-dehydro-6-deoxyglucose reductase, E3